MPRLLRPMNDRDHYLQERETPRAWARRVWASWTAYERAEFAAAVQIIMDKNRGAGEGSPAQKRKRDRDKPDWHARAGKYPWYRYNPDAKSDHMGRWD